MIRIRPKKSNFHAEKVEIVLNITKDKETNKINQKDMKSTIEQIRANLLDLAKEDKQ